VTPEKKQLAIGTEDAMGTWTGDLDALIERQVIRVLTSYSKTFYFHDMGNPRGTGWARMSGSATWSTSPPIRSVRKQ
jgi:hypothetical protein